MYMSGKSRVAAKASKIKSEIKVVLAEVAAGESGSIQFKPGEKERQI